MLIQVAGALGKDTDIMLYVKKISEINPDNYKILIQLALNSIQSNDIDNAIRYFELAVKSKDLDNKSIDYVVIMNELGRLYFILQRNEDAGRCFEVLFDAFTSPESYQLDKTTLRKLNPNPREYFEDMGTVFLETKRYELSQAAFEKAVESSRSNKEVLGFNLARLYFKQEMWGKARDELKKYFAAKLNVKGTAPYSLLADILTKENKKELILAELLELQKNDPENPELLNYLADYYLENSELSKAEELLASSKKIKNSANVKLGFLKLYRKSHNAEKMLEIFAEMIGDRAQLSRLETELEQLSKDEVLGVKLLEHGRQRQAAGVNKLSFAETFLLGKVAVQFKKIDDAKFFYNLARSLEPDREDQLTRELILFLLREKQYTDAQQMIEKKLDEVHSSEDKATYSYLLAETQRLNKQIDAAVETIRDVQKIDPENSTWLMQEGIIYSYAHRWLEAAQVFEKVIKTFAEDTEIVRQAKMNLSNAFVQAGDYPRGEKILEEIFQNDPENIGVNNDLGYLYADNNKNLDQAEMMVKKALDAEPENGAYIDSMGWVLYRRGKFKEALELLEKAVEKRNGGDGVIFDHLGDCYQAVGNTDKAKEFWQKALDDELGNDYPTQSLIDSIRKKLNHESK